MRKFIAPLGLLCFLVLSGSTVKLNQQQGVEVGISLPHSGNFNEWYIVFKPAVGGDSYEFYTDDNTFESEILGSLPPGEYDITFDSGYHDTTFDIGVYDADGLDWETGYPYATIYGQTIVEGASVQIDCVWGCY